MRGKCYFCATMKHMTYLIVALAAVMLAACHGRDAADKEQLPLVGAWKQVHGQSGLDRCMIIYPDSAIRCFLPGNEDLSDASDVLMVSGGGSVMNDSMLACQGDTLRLEIMCDSVFRLSTPDREEDWIPDPEKPDSVVHAIITGRQEEWRRETISEELMKELRGVTEGLAMPGDHTIELVSLTEYRVRRQRPYIYGGVGTLLLLLLSAVGYGWHARKARRHIERQLAQIEAERQWATEESKRQREENEARFLQTEYYQHLRKKIETGEAMKQSDWDELEAHISLLAPDFQSKLTSLYRLSVLENRVCQLTKIHLTPTEIATLTCKTQSAISALRGRLYQKVFDRKGTGQDWDKFILSL